MTQSPPAPPEVSSPVAPAPGKTRYRPELQGLRALACALVVIYHVWLDRVSGGVDVFFFVTGFLITGQLFRASLRDRVRFRATWGRFVKRLFPATMTVLVGTVVAAYFLLPETRWEQTASEIVASALFFENWQLAAQSADYFAQHDQASVVQHFWSLSIQGQFYLVWPLLIAAFAFVVKRLGGNLHRWLIGLLLVLTAGSLAYSVYLTAADQQFAYFMSATRVWEFAIGGLVALSIDKLSVPRAIRVLLGWLGVAGLVLCGLVLQVGTMFPGYVALWPVVAAALVLVAGQTGTVLGADRILSSRPLNYLGNLSFSLYLWHWPVLLFYVLLRDRPEVGLRGGAVIIAASLALAMLTYHLVEQPVLRAKLDTRTVWGSYRVGAATLAVVLAMAGAWQLAAVERATFVQKEDDPAHPGAEVLSPDGPSADGGAEPIPPFAALPKQYDNFTQEQCRHSGKNEIVIICNESLHPNPTRRIVVAGDSHSQQFNAALRPAAEKAGWEIISMGRGGCPLTTEAPNNPECTAWNETVMQEILEIKPDAVFTMASRDAHPMRDEITPPGYVEQWRTLEEAGIPVIAARDNPRYNRSLADCAEKRGVDDPSCSVSRDAVYDPQPSWTAVESLPENVHFVDFSDYFCTPTECPPMIGNVLVYLDNNHITKAYMKTLSPMVQERVSGILDRVG
ncbi:MULTISPECIES: acyltransferase family protein [Prauserella salsuginis group]|uniref:Peptidoglycan/LPS O-acetylase OafA/YrhL n=2 Tax=Prauserella salsuginis group TaxID=2893672 RepID=A0A839XUZ1_9PSEU|nr:MULTISPECIES: acyltransferase family protein [Prauserella salsuginis group]MBB3664868.1 peptidoglycan/LPS O-acetylase OafA/YrhL [Prauserella sediminis]MCR3718338.1 Peptidoglycan/LPS O-acetylase OafA/YrhL, contains acyltransferase and SGNH-hydrolase domains [Prauserella flava]MCR3732908.1 Peptidoglycan/LPS O-acetylase OafA/YrhL, contains acyltransferase and SGNH-hydrolase domains [Prauserella salsuginis]